MPTTISGDIEGKNCKADNPLPVTLISGGVAGLPENYASVWAITREDGQPDSETVTLSNGDSYKRTFTYTGYFLTGRSAWVKQ